MPKLNWPLIYTHGFPELGVEAFYIETTTEMRPGGPAYQGSSLLHRRRNGGFTMSQIVYPVITGSMQREEWFSGRWGKLFLRTDRSEGLEFQTVLLDIPEAPLRPLGHRPGPVWPRFDHTRYARKMNIGTHCFPGEPAWVPLQALDIRAIWMARHHGWNLLGPVSRYWDRRSWPSELNGHYNLLGFYERAAGSQIQWPIFRPVSS